MVFIKRLLLLLLIASPSYSQSGSPQFTTGSMTQTITTNQTIEEISITERFGSEVETWNGDNVTTVDATADGFDASTIDIEVDGLGFSIVDDSKPWQLEVISREAGALVETIDTTRTIETDSVTNTLSVFSQ